MQVLIIKANLADQSDLVFHQKMDKLLYDYSYHPPGGLAWGGTVWHLPWHPRLAWASHAQRDTLPPQKIPLPEVYFSQDFRERDRRAPRA